MPSKDKTDSDQSSIDKIEPIEESVDDEGTAVISVKLGKEDKSDTKTSKKKSKKTEKKTKEEEIEETIDTSVDDSKQASETVKHEEESSVSQEKDDEPKEPAIDLATKQVSSFSQLDADKVVEDEESKVKETDNQTGIQSDTQKSQEDLTQDVKKWLEDIHPEARPEDAGGGINFKSILLILFLLLVLGLIVGGFYFYQTSQESTEQTNSSPTPTVAQAVTPTPTATPEKVDLSSLSVQVLNGSGVSGAAGTAATELESAGFVDVVAGNASSSDFEETEVAMKEDTPEAVFDTIKTTLDDKEVVLDEETLDAESEYDIIITLGSSASANNEE